MVTSFLIWHQLLWTQNCCQRTPTEPATERNYSATPEPIMSHKTQEANLQPISLCCLFQVRARKERKGQSPLQTHRQHRWSSQIGLPQSDLTHTHTLHRPVLWLFTYSTGDIIMCITRVLAFVPGPVMHSKLRGELGKYCTKEKVSGELLTNTEQRASRGGGRRGWERG